LRNISLNYLHDDEVTFFKLDFNSIKNIIFYFVEKRDSGKVKKMMHATFDLIKFFV
jgi:hypothetical protein